MSDIFKIVILILAACNFCHAQVSVECGTDELQSYLEAEGIINKEQEERIESQYRKDIIRWQYSTAKRYDEELVIPVFFHIFNTHVGEDISDAQILDALANLNAAFAAAGVYQANYGVDTKIRFCLAKRDEEGKPTNGIRRYTSPLANVNGNADIATIGINYHIKTKEYLNISIVNEICGDRCIGGLAYLPAVHGNPYEGVWVIKNDFYRTVNPNSTLVHEAGHYLGLRHTFREGCKNSNCLEDGDYVCDTPPTGGLGTGVYSCADGSIRINTCHTDTIDSSINNPYRPISLGGLGDQPDMIHNFMSYGFYRCVQHFTEGQAQRMRFMLEKIRYPLLQSKSCVEPCSDGVILEMSAIKDTMMLGDTLFANTASSHFAKIMWYFNGELISTDNQISRELIKPGINLIRLEGITNDFRCDSVLSITKQVYAQCPLQGCITVDTIGSNVYFTYCGTDELESISWRISNLSNSYVFTSNEMADSVKVEHISALRICQEISNAFCATSACEIIDFPRVGEEICDNELDDDGDGLMDAFDPDCDCTDQYHAMCPDSCLYTPPSDFDFSMKMKWMSGPLSTYDQWFNYLANPTVFNSGQNNSVRIFIPAEYSNSLFNNDPDRESYLLEIDPRDGSIIDTIVTEIQMRRYYKIASADVKRDGMVNLFATALNRVEAYTENGDKLYTILDDIDRYSIHFADFNHDGNAELYFRNKIFNATTGVKLLDIPESSGCNPGNVNCARSTITAADLLPSAGLELASGNRVYEIQLTNPKGEAGNSYVVNQAAPEVEDGSSIVADIDGDGLPDIVVYRYGRNRPPYLAVWNPRTGALIANGVPGIDRGGMPSIADLDGDCIPEIAVVYQDELRVFKYNGTTTLEIMHRIPLQEESGFTSVSFFDFNQDGYPEIVCRDEVRLMIISGLTGQVMSQFALIHDTYEEYPIIVDIDGDGEAEILMSGYLPGDPVYRLFCFESAGSPWAPARSVWNQYGYHVTNVNDDMTIPRQMQNGAVPLQGTENCPQEECSTPYNNFMVQATYRTQAGCRVWPSKDEDLYVTEAQAVCTQDSIELCIGIHYKEENALNTGVKVQVFPVSSGVSATEALIHHVTHSAEMCFHLPKDISAEELLIVLNSSSGQYPPQYTDTDIAECNYDNNSYTVRVPDFDLYIETIRWECTPDSLIFYVLAGVSGTGYEDRCHNIICYLDDPVTAEGSPIEITAWCADTIRVQVDGSHSDTLRFAMPLPYGESRMYFTINDTGFGPGWDASVQTGVPECDYSNNITHFDFDIERLLLDIGSDIMKCETEVFTLDAGAGFVSYLWSDFSSDRIYSSAEVGLHHVETTDHCHRKYRDTIEVIIDRSQDIVLGEDRILCPEEDLQMSISTPYDQIEWYIGGEAICSGCITLPAGVTHHLLPGDSLLLSVWAVIGGCISTDSLVVYRMQGDTTQISVSLCHGEQYDFGGEILTASGEYIRSVNGCEQYEALQLQVYEDNSINEERSICIGDSVLIGTEWAYTSGVYEYEFTDENGCKAHYRMNLEVTEVLTGSTEIRLCLGDSVQIGGEWYREAISLTETTSLANGCDSMHMYHISLEIPPERSSYVEICYGSTYEYKGIPYTEEGIYEIRVSTGEVCDSLIRLHLRVLPEIKTTNVVELCAGDSVEVGGQTITATSMIAIQYESAAGCDSTIIWDIRVSAPEERKLQIEKCAGDTLHLDGRAYHIPGIYIDTLREASCMVIRALELIDIALMEEYRLEYLCPGDSIAVGGVYYAEAGIYRERLRGSEQCDTIRLTELRILNMPESETEIDCESISVELTLTGMLDGWQINWDNGATGPSVRYTGGSTAVVDLRYGDCERSLEIILPLLPKLDQLKVPVDTVLETGRSVILDLGLSSDEWQVIWHPHYAVSCSDCMNVEISATETTEILLRLIHVSGCEYNYRFRVIAEKIEDILIPNIIIPGRGNANSIWTVVPIGGTMIEEVHIYDRWGNMVHHVSGASSWTWDGTNRGRDVEAGVYVYMINYRNAAGELKVITGDVTVIR